MGRGWNNMEIKTEFEYQGKTYPVTYKEADPTNDLEGKILNGVHAYCFCGDKFVLVYNQKKDHYTPPGGGIEPGETYEQAIIREVKEESNMKVISQELIGYQDVVDIANGDRVIRQVRSFCIVEPYGDFVSDPDGDITAIKLIDPKDYKQYFDWGKIGDRIMERALEIYNGKSTSTI